MVKSKINLIQTNQAARVSAIPALKTSLQDLSFYNKLTKSTSPKYETRNAFHYKEDFFKLSESED